MVVVVVVVVVAVVVVVVKMVILVVVVEVDGAVDVVAWYKVENALYIVAYRIMYFGFAKFCSCRLSSTGLLSFWEQQQ